MIADLKPYQAYKDSGVEWLGEVPEHWEIRRLQSSVRGCVNGIWGQDPNGFDDILCIRVADFDRNCNRVRIENPTIRAVANSELRNRRLTVGDLLLEKSGGGDLQPVGIVVLFDHTVAAICSNFIARMPVSSSFDSLYLTYLHSHLYSIQLNTRAIKQTTGIQNLSSAAYLSEPVAFPPFSEQKAIARFLDHVDRRIRRYIRAKQKLIELLDEQKQAIIHRAVTRGLDPDVQLKPSGVEWLGDVPAHWVVGRVKQFARILRGKFTHRPRNDPGLYGGPYPFIQTGDVARANKYISSYNQTLNARGFAVSKSFPVGTLVMTIAANIGDVAILSFEACFPDSIVGFAPRLTTDHEFLYYLFRSMREELLCEAPINTQGNLNIERVGARGVALPPFAEQQIIAGAIARDTNRLSAGIAQGYREIDLLREYRTRLIADVVTGKLDVREAASRLPEDGEEPEPFDEEELDGEATVEEAP